MEIKMLIGNWISELFGGDTGGRGNKLSLDANLLETKCFHPIIQLILAES